jgi:hypothetical protein
MQRAKTAVPPKHQSKHSFGAGARSANDDFDDLEDPAEDIDIGSGFGSARGSANKFDHQQRSTD